MSAASFIVIAIAITAEVRCLTGNWKELDTFAGRDPSCGEGTGLCIMEKSCPTNKGYLPETGHCRGISQYYDFPRPFVCCKYSDTIEKPLTKPIHFPAEKEHPMITGRDPSCRGLCVLNEKCPTNLGFIPNEEGHCKEITKTQNASRPFLCCKYYDEAACMLNDTNPDSPFPENNGTVPDILIYHDICGEGKGRCMLKEKCPPKTGYISEGESDECKGLTKLLNSSTPYLCCKNSDGTSMLNKTIPDSHLPDGGSNSDKDNHIPELHDYSCKGLCVQSDSCPIHKGYIADNEGQCDGLSKAMNSTKKFQCCKYSDPISKLLNSSHPDHKEIDVFEGLSTCRNGKGLCTMKETCPMDKGYIPDDQGGHCQELTDALNSLKPLLCCNMDSNALLPKGNDTHIDLPKEKPDEQDVLEVPQCHGTCIMGKECPSSSGFFPDPNKGYCTKQSNFQELFVCCNTDSDGSFPKTNDTNRDHQQWKPDENGTLVVPCDGVCFLSKGCPTFMDYLPNPEGGHCPSPKENNLTGYIVCCKPRTNETIIDPQDSPYYGDTLEIPQCHGTCIPGKECPSSLGFFPDPNKGDCEKKKNFQKPLVCCNRDSDSSLPRRNDTNLDLPKGKPGEEGPEIDYDDPCDGMCVQGEKCLLSYGLYPEIEGDCNALMKVNNFQKPYVCCKHSENSPFKKNKTDLDYPKEKDTFQGVTMCGEGTGLCELKEHCPINRLYVVDDEVVQCKGLTEALQSPMPYYCCNFFDESPLKTNDTNLDVPKRIPGVFQGITSCGGGTGMCVLKENCPFNRRYVVDDDEEVQCKGLTDALNSPISFYCCRFFDKEMGIRKEIPEREMFDGISTCARDTNLCMRQESCPISKGYIPDDEGGHCKGITEVFRSKIPYLCCKYSEECKIKFNETLQEGDGQKDEPKPIIKDTFKGLPTCRGGAGTCILRQNCPITEGYVRDDTGGHCNKYTEKFKSPIPFLCCKYSEDIKVQINKTLLFPEKTTKPDVTMCGERTGLCVRKEHCPINRYFIPDNEGQCNKITEALSSPMPFQCCKYFEENPLKRNDTYLDLPIGNPDEEDTFEGITSCGGGTGMCVLKENCPIHRRSMSDDGEVQCKALREALNSPISFYCCKYFDDGHFKTKETNLDVQKKKPEMFDGISTCARDTNLCIRKESCPISKGYIPDDEGGHCKGITEVFRSKVPYLCCKYSEECKKTFHEEFEGNDTQKNESKTDIEDTFKGLPTCRGGAGTCILRQNCPITEGYVRDDTGGHCNKYTEKFKSPIPFLCCKYSEDIKNKLNETRFGEDTREPVGTTCEEGTGLCVLKENCPNDKIYSPDDDGGHCNQLTKALNSPLSFGCCKYFDAEVGPQHIPDGEDKFEGITSCEGGTGMCVLKENCPINRRKISDGKEVQCKELTEALNPRMPFYCCKYFDAEVGPQHMPDGGDTVDGVATCAGVTKRCIRKESCPISKGYIPDDEGGHCKGVTETHKSPTPFLCCKYDEDTKNKLNDTNLKKHPSNPEINDTFEEVSTCREGNGMCIMRENCPIKKGYIPDDEGGNCNEITETFKSSTPFMCCKHSEDIEGKFNETKKQEETNKFEGLNTCRGGKGVCIRTESCFLNEGFMPDDEGGHCRALTGVFNSQPTFKCCKPSDEFSSKPDKNAMKSLKLVCESFFPKNDSHTSSHEDLDTFQGISSCGSGKGFCVLNQACPTHKGYIPDDEGGHCNELTKTFNLPIPFLCCKDSGKTNV